jgi:hypothetical protein
MQNNNPPRNKQMRLIGMMVVVLNVIVVAISGIVSTSNDTIVGQNLAPPYL